MTMVIVEEKPVWGFSGWEVAETGGPLSSDVEDVRPLCTLRLRLRCGIGFYGYCVLGTVAEVFPLETFLFCLDC